MYFIVITKKNKPQRKHKKWHYYEGNNSARDINSISNLGGVKRNDLFALMEADFEFMTTPPL
jgi:hypothetical protein